MAATAGRVLRVKVGTATGGPFNTVVGITAATMSRQGLTVDNVTTLTDSDIVRILGIKDNRLTLEGNYETDTTGQAVIRSAYDNDTELWFQFLPDGATGWKQQCRVAKYEIGGQSGANKISVSIELEGTGPVTAI